MNGIIKRVVPLLAFLCVAVPALAEPIIGVSVVGNQNVNLDAVKAQIGRLEGSEYTPEAATAAVEQIKAMGFFSSVAYDQQPVQGGIQLIFRVVEYPKISQITIVGNTVFTAKEITDVLLTKVGLVFNQLDAIKDYRGLERRYEDKGNIVFVEPFSFDTTDGSKITLLLKEVRVEAIEIVGLKKTKPNVLLREMHTKVGDIFNAQTMQQDLNKIHALRLFSELNYSREIGSDLDKLKVVINATEDKVASFNIGAGYNATSKLFGLLEYEDRNFRGLAHKLNGRYLFGGGASKDSMEAYYTIPWITKKGTELSVGAWDSAYNRFGTSLNSVGSTSTADGYYERRQGASVSVATPMSRFDTMRWTLRTQSTSSHIDAASTATFLVQDSSIYSLSSEWIRDTRDWSFEPVGGGLDSVLLEAAEGTLEEGYGFAGRDIAYQRIKLNLRRYHAIGKRPPIEKTDMRSVIAMRLQAGYTNGPLPFYEQFFVGGSESIRGYAEDRFWGDQMLMMSAEFRKPVSKALSLVLFTDAGDAWGGDWRTTGFADYVQHDKFEPTVGYGVGVRFQLPIGTMRIDIGFGDEGSQTHFSFGNVF
ncbi:MAG: BamA/OMP85 family outer membrane protein [Armatimonadota bacterium]